MDVVISIVGITLGMLVTKAFGGDVQQFLLVSAAIDLSLIAMRLRGSK